MIATVLYEDQRGPTNEFGLHRLVVACVWDRVTIARPELQRFELEKLLKDARPLKGSGNLLTACRRDAQLISHKGQPLFAVFDNDEVRRLLRLPADAEETVVAQKILEGSTAPERVRVHLLRENMESVVTAVRECAPSLTPEAVANALAKSLSDRDIVLRAVAREERRVVRDCVLQRVPSLARMIDDLARVVTERLPS